MLSPLSFQSPAFVVFVVSTVVLIAGIMLSPEIKMTVRTEAMTPSIYTSELANDYLPVELSPASLEYNSRNWTTFRGYYPNPKVKVNTFVGEIGDFLSGVLCGVIAVGALPGYLAVELAVRNARHDEGVRTTRDQDFYIFPVHGSISHDAPITIHYSAWTARAAMTFGRHIFIAEPRPVGGFDPSNFQKMPLLIHEFTHSVQYEEVGWFTPTFGLKYLFGLCKAAFSYRDNPMEAVAYFKQTWMDQLLSGFGLMFFCAWKVNDLDAVLGLPQTRMHSIVHSAASPSSKVAELRFQRGVLQLSEPNPNEFRFYTEDEIRIRNLAFSPPPRCKELSHLSHGGREFPDPILECTAEEMAQLLKRDQAKREWRTLDHKPLLNFNCPIFQNPPPPPNCPTACEIHDPVPITSHSCDKDPPPEGCDPTIRELNKWCRSERKRCGMT